MMKRGLIRNVDDNGGDEWARTKESGWASDYCQVQLHLDLGPRPTALSTVSLSRGLVQLMRIVQFLF
jgi:hypothetical protein